MCALSSPISEDLTIFLDEETKSLIVEVPPSSTLWPMRLMLLLLCGCQSGTLKEHWYYSIPKRSVQVHTVTHHTGNVVIVSQYYRDKLDISRLGPDGNLIDMWTLEFDEQMWIHSVQLNGDQLAISGSDNSNTEVFFGFLTFDLSDGTYRIPTDTLQTPFDWEASTWHGFHTTDAGWLAVGSIRVESGDRWDNTGAALVHSDADGNQTFYNPWDGNALESNWSPNDGAGYGLMEFDDLLIVDGFSEDSAHLTILDADGQSIQWSDSSLELKSDSMFVPWSRSWGAAVADGVLTWPIHLDGSGEVGTVISQYTTDGTLLSRYSLDFRTCLSLEGPQGEGVLSTGIVDIKALASESEVAVFTCQDDEDYPYAVEILDAETGTLLRSRNAPFSIAESAQIQTVSLQKDIVVVYLNIPPWETGEIVVFGMP